MHACVMTFKLGMQIFLVTSMLVHEHILLENVPVETFNISSEGTQNKQHYATNMTCTEVRKKKEKKHGELKFD